MAKIVAISGTDPATPPPTVLAVAWAVVLGVTGYIFWSVVKPARRR